MRSTRRFLRLMVDGLRKLAERAGRVPSLGYGVAYLAAIPIFALFYFVLAFDFYNGTARYEPMVVEQSTGIGDRLRSTYLADAKGSSKGAVAVPLLYGKPIRETPTTGWPIFEVHPEPGHVRILVTLAMNKPQRTESWLVTVELDIDKHAKVQKPNFADREFYRNQLLYVTATPRILYGVNVDVAELFPCGDMEGSACLRMTVADEVLLFDLGDTAAGRPWQEQSSYMRMLYFSAVTISTLGYGDIVPVTSRARLLVTVEVILGPLLFGLFLNSLVKEGAERIRVKVESGPQDGDKPAE